MKEAKRMFKNHFLKVALLIIVFICSFNGFWEKGIKGKVVDPAGNGLVGVIVRIENSSYKTVTEKDGTYLIDYTPGSFNVRFTKDGYTVGSIELNLYSKDLFPAEAIILYPIYPKDKIYAPTYPQDSRLSPKDEWDIFSKGKLYAQISNNEISMNKEMVLSLFTVKKDQLGLFNDEIMINIQKNIRSTPIVGIDKIIDIRKRNIGVIVDVVADRKNSSNSEKIKLTFVKSKQFNGEFSLALGMGQGTLE